MIIEKIKQYTGLQFLLFLVVLLAFCFSAYTNWEKPLYSLSPIIDLGELEDANWFRILILACNFCLLILCLFELSNLLRNHHFASESKIEQLLLLSVFMILFPNPLFNFPLLLSSFLLLRSFRFLFLVHTQVKISKELALMAFYMSLCSMLFPPAIFLAILIYLGVIQQRGFYLKEVTLFLIVFALPYYFLYSFFYLVDLPLNYDWALQFNRPALNLGGLVSYLVIALGLLMLLLLFFSVTYNSKEVLRSKVQFRNFYYLLFFALFWLFFIDANEGIGLTFVPLLAIYVQSYPRLRKKWIIEGVILLLFLLGFIFQLFQWSTS
jgi:hypothetical protein